MTFKGQRRKKNDEEVTAAAAAAVSAVAAEVVVTQQPCADVSDGGGDDFHSKLEGKRVQYEMAANFKTNQAFLTITVDFCFSLH